MPVALLGFRSAARAGLAVLALTWLLIGAETPSAAASSALDYAKPAAWLCRPGRSDACSGDLSASIVALDGRVTHAPFEPNPHAPIDCFYVYPTVSRDPAPNSDIKAGPGEREAALSQFAPFGSRCRLFAPIYRQVTIAGLRGGADHSMPYRDVLAAWNAYLAHDNSGRGFVLIGHSQGAGILKNLIVRHIDGKPLQSRLVSAILPGTGIDIPALGEAGGTFAHIPPCRSGSETGCFIGYSSYLASDPPDRRARFGRGSRAGTRDACVDPAVLDGGGTTLEAYLPLRRARGGGRFDLGFLELAGLVSAKCAAAGGRDYLAISVGAGEPAAKVLAILRGAAQPSSWGLHVLDLNLALGNLVDIVGREGRAWVGRHSPAGAAAQ